jgi:rsbT co-antagonist protein RsbR
MSAKAPFDEAELKSRRAFFEITDEDLALLASLRSFAEKHTQEVVEDLYELILNHPDARKLFLDHMTVTRVKAAQREYFLGLFTGKLDLAYVEARFRVGVAHERVGVPPKWYLGAYARYLRVIFKKLKSDLPAPERAMRAYESVEKLVFFDMALAMDTYIRSQIETIQRHQVAIRELSTPVIRLHEHVLLLPLIGTVDTQRAEQLMESALLRVVEDQARVVIIDIAGVPVVDTKVADHLLKTTEAVRLLGAQTILSGISPTVAKTIVNLGMDVSAMHTRSNLANALELAFTLLNKRIRGGKTKKRGAKRRRAEAR